MAWLSRVNFIASDTLSFSDINNLGNDIRAWGGNVNGGGYVLSNVVLSASAGTMATVTGGTGAASTLTIQSTSGAGTSDAIIFQTASQSEKMRITTAGQTGMGTATPATESTNARLAVVGAASQAASTLATSNSNAGFTVRTNTSSGYQLAIGATSVDGSPYLQGVTFNGGSSASNLILQGYGGNVGIGATNPGATLPTGMTAGGKILEIGSTVDIGLCLRRTDGVVGLDIWCDCTGDSSYDTRFVNRFVNSDFKFYNGSTQQFCITYGGFVGVGAATPRTTFSVLQSGTANTTGDTLGPAVFTGPTTGNYSAMLVIDSNDAMAADKGGSIGFYGRNTSASVASSYFSSIHGLKENGTSGNQAGYLAFKVRTAGNANPEVMRIASTGNVGIGTTSPGATLPSGMTALAKVLEVRSDAVSQDVGLFLRRSDGVTGLDIWHDSSADANYDTRFVNIFSSSAFAFYNGTTEQLRITSGGNVGIGTASPAASAKLDIGGTTGALLVPRLTTTERNALTAVNGMIIYNTTDNQMQGRINGAWAAM